MKVRPLPILVISTAIFGAIFGCVQLVTAAPALLFRPVLKDIRSQLPKDMVIRLPAFVPNADIKGVNTYARVRGYQTVTFLSVSPAYGFLYACSVSGIGGMRSHLIYRIILLNAIAPNISHNSTPCDRA
jgi:hypothetical protein